MRLLVTLLFLLFTTFCFESGTASLIRKNGKSTIVALLPVHTATDSKQCSKELNFKSAVQSQALKYAVEKIKLDPSFAMISLGFDIEQICNEKPEDLLNMVTTLFKTHKNGKLTSFLVDLPDLLNQLVAHKSHNVPVFSLRSHPDQNNVFYLESKPRIGNALAKFVQDLNWTIFDVFVANSKDYELFLEATKTVKVCINRVFYEKFISGQSYNIDKELYPILVFSSSLKTLKNLSANFSGRNIVIANEYLDIDEQFSKTLAVRRHVENLNDFEDFLVRSAKSNGSWFGAELIRNSAQARACGGPGNESCWSEILGKLSSKVRYGAKVIDVVYTIAHALNNSKSTPLTNQDIIKTPKFTSPTGKQICFTQNKDLTKTEYSVYNLAENPAVLLGNLQTFADKTISEVSLDGLETNRDTSGCLVTCPDSLFPVPTMGKFAKCCVTCENENLTTCENGLRWSKDQMKCVEVRLDYLKWKHPLSIIIFILVILLFCVILYLVNLYHKKAYTSTILTSKLATMPLLMSLFITLIHPLLPIIKPSSTSCNAYVFGFVQALGIPICILISRSNTYHKRFRNGDGSLKKKVCRSNPQNLIAVFLILFQITLSIIFIEVSSARVVYYETADPYVDYIECSTFSGQEFLFPFFYTIILALFFTVKNFGAATHQADSYESHFTALFFFGYYFLSFLNIVVVYAVVGKGKVMLLCVLGVLHLLNFLCFLFFPKVYVIVLKWDPKRFSPPNTSDQEVLILDLGEQTIEQKEAGSP